MVDTNVGNSTCMVTHSSPIRASADMTACTEGRPSRCSQAGAPFHRWARWPVRQADANTHATTSRPVASFSRLHNPHQCSVSTGTTNAYRKSRLLVKQVRWSFLKSCVSQLYLFSVTHPVAAVPIYIVCFCWNNMDQQLTQLCFQSCVSNAKVLR